MRLKPSKPRLLNLAEASLSGLPRKLGVREIFARRLGQCGPFSVLAQFDPVPICLRAFCCEISAEQKTENALFPREIAR